MTIGCLENISLLFTCGECLYIVDQKDYTMRECHVIFFI